MNKNLITKLTTKLLILGAMFSPSQLFAAGGGDSPYVPHDPAPTFIELDDILSLLPVAGVLIYLIGMLLIIYSRNMKRRLND